VPDHLARTPHDDAAPFRCFWIAKSLLQSASPVLVRYFSWSFCLLKSTIEQAHTYAQYMYRSLIGSRRDQCLHEAVSASKFPVAARCELISSASQRNTAGMASIVHNYVYVVTCQSLVSYIATVCPMTRVRPRSTFDVRGGHQPTDDCLQAFPDSNTARATHPS